VKMSPRRNALLAGVARTVAEAARAHGVAADIAEQIGAAAADEVAQDWGGQIITIPTDFFYRIAKRDIRILQEIAEGASPHEIAKRYNMTEVAVRKLRQRKELRGAHLRQISFIEEDAT